MLKGINRLISPELMKILMEMGHGDEIMFGDANFPHAAFAKRLVRADGLNTPDLLKAIVALFPLDYVVDYSAILCQITAGNVQPDVWDKYDQIIRMFDHGNKGFLQLPKPDFYERAKGAYCIVATGEREKFANIILRKGVIVE